MENLKVAKTIEGDFVVAEQGSKIVAGLGCRRALTREEARMLSAAPEMWNALKCLTVRFPLEGFNATTRSCTCNQFMDGEGCRHTLALRAIAKAEGK